MKTNKQWIWIAVLASFAFMVQSSIMARAQDYQDQQGQQDQQNDQDPPGRVARLSYAQGSVSFQPAGEGDWVTAVPNRPMVTGDNLWADEDSRAEVHIGSAALRLGAQTGITFLDITDNATQIRLAQGSLLVRVRHVDDDDSYEIDTPNLAFNVLQPGEYRIDVSADGNQTITTTFHGRGRVTGGGFSYNVVAGQSATFTGSDHLDYDIGQVPDQDDFDQWAFQRDEREDQSDSANYVSREMTGYEDLDANGDWSYVAGYGECWRPRAVVVGWAPYRFGHWVWVGPWGWTWVEDEPWGFAPFHYGRWVVVGGVWGWVPSPPRPVGFGVVYVRPVYAPALVAWVGGPHFSVGIGIGGGGGVGVAWFPLGPRDVYCPSYHVSQRYVQNVNISNTTVINQTHITNVYNNVYVNKTVNVTNVTYQNQSAANAVTATSHQAFTSAQPVGRNMVKVDAREVASAPVAPMTPAVAPQQHSVLGSGATGSARPPAAVFNRQVVAKNTPPPPPVSFTKQQQVIQANGGRPVGISQMRQTQVENVQAARPNIKIAPPSQPGTPRGFQGNRPGGNIQSNQGNAQNNPGNAQSNSGNMQNNSNRPPVPNTSSPANPGNAQNNTGNVQNNGNRPPVPSTSSPTNPGSRNVNPPANNGNAPSNAGNPRVYNDRPPSNRPNNSNTVDPQIEQRHQQQLQQLQQKQDQERQKVEQRQVQEQQRIQQKNADDARRQQTDQRQQQQLQQLEQRHEQQQQKLEQKQTQEHQKQDRPKDNKPSNTKPPKEEKPHNK